MSIMDDYKQLRMIENVKKIKEMELGYKSNLKLCKYQEQQINKLANCIEEIKEIAGKIANYYDGDEYELMRKDAEQILQKISECEANQ